MRMRRILLFDTVIDGHHADYLTHLITYWLRVRPAGELLVAAQASFEPVFRQLLEGATEPASVRFVPISQQEIDNTHQASAQRRSFREWNLQLAYIHTHRPTHVLLMYFDIFQLGLWLGQKAPCAVSGIYFRPDFHYTVSLNLKARLNILRKKITLRGVLNRGVLANLFCLDHSAVAALRHMDPQVNVLPLPDPVKSYTIAPAEVNQLRDELRIEPGRRVFLLFGYLDERKGIEPLLEALNLVNPATRPQISVLLVGAIQPDYQAQIEQRIAAVSPDVQVISVFREIRGRLIQTYFELADYALALYQRHVGMASVIIRAAISGKPLLASDFGYMGKLVSTEELGAIVDSTSPAAISELIENVVASNLHYSAANLQKVASQHSDEAFAKMIFDHL